MVDEPPSDPPGTPRLGSWFPEAVVALTFLAAASLLSVGRAEIVTSEDEASYLLAARAVEDGHGFTCTWAPGAPPYVRYPPGQPLLLALAESVLGRGPEAPRWLSIGCTVLALAAACRLLQALLGRMAGLACGLVLACSPLLWRFSGSALSEPPCQVLVLASLLAGLRWQATGRARWAWMGLATGLAAVGIRIASLPLLAAWVIAAATRRGAGQRARIAWEAAALVTLAAGIGAWLLWSGRDGEREGEYARSILSSEFRDLDAPPSSVSSLATRATENAGRYARGATDDLLHHFGKLGAAEWPARIAALLLVLFGAGSFCRRRQTLPPIWAAGHLAVCLLLPDYEGGRYLYPVLPILLACLWEGGRVCLPVRARRIAAVIAALALAASALRVALPLSRSPGVPSTAMTRYLAAANRIRAEAAEGDVVVCRKPCVLALATGLRAVPFLYTRRAEALGARLRESKARWIIVDEIDPTSATFLAPSLSELPLRLLLVFQRQGTRVYLVQ